MLSSGPVTPPEVLMPYKVASTCKYFVPFAGGVSGFLRRNAFIKDFGFVYLTKECAQALTEFLMSMRCLDVGSGTGWLSHLLAERGVETVAADKGGDAFAQHRMSKVWKRDFEGDAVTLLPGEFDAVILTWPHVSSGLASRVVDTMKQGQVLVYQGEGSGGCTAEEAFFDVIENTALWEPLETVTRQLNEVHVQFDGLHDTWLVARKR